MALPKLNDTIKYQTKIPSTGKQITFRPFLVKEEKVLLIASESKSRNAIMNAIVDTIEACVYDEINLRTLPIFDVEYLFLKIRAKSVGEKIEMKVPCSHCGTANEYAINVDSINIDVPKKKNNIIDLDGKIKIEMKYPEFSTISDSGITDDDDLSGTDVSFKMVLSCIEAVIVGEDRILLKDEPMESQMEFLDSFSNEQFNKIKSFIETIPKLKETIAFDCVSCGEHTEITLEGAQDFF